MEQGNPAASTSQRAGFYDHISTLRQGSIFKSLDACAFLVTPQLSSAMLMEEPVPWREIFYVQKMCSLSLRCLWFYGNMTDTVIYKVTDWASQSSLNTFSRFWDFICPKYKAKPLKHGLIGPNPGTLDIYRWQKTKNNISKLHSGFILFPVYSQGNEKQDISLSQTKQI